MAEALQEKFYSLSLFDMVDPFETKQFQILVACLEDFLTIMAGTQKSPQCIIEKILLSQKTLSDAEKAAFVDKTKKCVINSEDLRNILLNEKDLLNDEMINALMSYLLMKLKKCLNEADWAIFTDFKRLFNCLFELRKCVPLENLDLDPMIIAFAQQLIVEINETPKTNYVNKVRLVNVMAKMLIEIGFNDAFTIPLLRLVIKEVQVYFNKLSNLKGTKQNNCYETEAYMLFLKVISDILNPKITLQIKALLEDLRKMLQQIVKNKKVSPYVVSNTRGALEKIEMFLSLLNGTF